MVLHVMGEMLRLGKVIEDSRRARGAEGKAIEECGEVSGGHGPPLHTGAPDLY